jgi:pyridoxal phosphate enzyme (YggS family)
MLLENLSEIKNRIAEAATRANRQDAEIKFVAVSKRVSAGMMLQALDLGQHIFGENYVQEALEKIPHIQQTAKHKAVFHFIGKLQRNKAKKAAELFDVIETVDSIKLGISLDKHCRTLNKTMEAYIQVNLGGEVQKSGVRPEDCQELILGLKDCLFLKITGLMTMPPLFTDPENVRPYFRELRKLSENLTQKGLLGSQAPVALSMGMSGDFEVAVEEGATVVRIGTALFGERSD